MVYVQMANYSKNDPYALFFVGAGEKRVKQGRIMHALGNVKVANRSCHSSGHYC